jgi:hypothetical protein
MRQPVLRAVIRTGILHDVFGFDALLVSHRGDAELEPVGIAEARRDDGEFHGGLFNIGLGNWQTLLDIQTLKNPFEMLMKSYLVKLFNVRRRNNL